MDNISDEHIFFNQEGICNYCLPYLKKEQPAPEAKEKKLLDIIGEIKKAGKNKPYDCILGISGGMDSTYTAYLAKQFNLRSLLVHFDNGWNSVLAVKNIKNIVGKLNFDFYTYVNDWKEFRDLQVAFLKASVLDIELLTDQAISATLFRTARKYKVKYIISGINSSTESILPSHWHHRKDDSLNIQGIHAKFGKGQMRTYPLAGFFEKLYAEKVLKIKSFHLLDYMEYNKEKARGIITNDLSWNDHGGKHHESIFTKFYQSYILPVKFGIDKRKAHLSSLICAGQLSREQALAQMQKNIYTAEELKQDREYILKKLNMASEEFENIMKQPSRKHTEYPSYLNRHHRYQKYFSRYLVYPLKFFFKKTGMFKAFH